ncbi:GntR family transcriptional regulator [Actinomycetospora soli]|uniref:GntR family transcriptional regulator n=1 Tax=Actinomycetospora soli TaxID=2893887 RepID=UPI001E58D32A|nr:GntR family transcriptional regulator [Actinomycetospora soli]MCD2190997.1 GntR family transcriptional regulator [Actinomycetospora soli]
MPKYREIAADLRDRRLGTEFTVGDRLPGITELARQYDDVALNTVRNAVTLLAEQQLLRIEHGVGTFVTALPDRSPAGPLAELRRTLDALGQALDDAVAHVSAQVADEAARARHEALAAAADDLEAMDPPMDIAAVPAWLRERAAHRG